MITLFLVLFKGLIFGTLNLVWRLFMLIIMAGVVVLFVVLIASSSLRQMNHITDCTTCDPNYHPVGYWDGHKTVYYTDKNNPYPRHTYTKLLPLEKDGQPWPH